METVMSNGNVDPIVGRNTKIGLSLRCGKSYAQIKYLLLKHGIRPVGRVGNTLIYSNDDCDLIEREARTDTAEA
jgi:hypothetical protein